MSALVITAIFTTLILWASGFVGIRASLSDYNPYHLALFRYLIASVVLLVFVFAKKVSLIRKKDIPLFFITGLVGFAIHNITLNVGELHISAASACFIVNTAPIITALIYLIFYKTKISFQGWLGMLISLLGVAVISVGESKGSSFLELNTSTLLVIIAAIATSAHVIFQKKLLDKNYSSIEVTCYGIWFGTLCMLPFSAGLFTAINNASASATISIIYLGIFPSVIAYILWAYTLSKIPAMKAVTFWYIIPIFSFVIAYIWLGEVPSILAMFGGFIALVGVFVVNNKQNNS